MPCSRGLLLFERDAEPHLLAARCANRPPCVGKCVDDPQAPAAVRVGTELGRRDVGGDAVFDDDPQHSVFDPQLDGELGAGVLDDVRDELGDKQLSDLAWLTNEGALIAEKAARRSNGTRIASKGTDRHGCTCTGSVSPGRRRNGGLRNTSNVRHRNRYSVIGVTTLSSSSYAAVVPEPADPVLSALEGIVAAVTLNQANNRLILRRAKALRSMREKGLPYRDIVPQEERPLVVELLRQNQERLALSGAAFRRAEAAALRSEGLTMDEIAAVFGVTRPRIIALLRDGAQGSGAGGARATPPPPGSNSAR